MHSDLHHHPSIGPLILTFVYKSDILLVCRSESLHWAFRLLCGRTVVPFPVEAIEHDLWRRRAKEKTQELIAEERLFG